MEAATLPETPRYPDVTAQPAALQPLPPMARREDPVPYREGDVHERGHKPLQTNRRGLYCPTKLADGSFCNWRPA